MATSRFRSEPPLVLIVGPTASGKTSLGIKLAKQYDGEIISADSRAIYRDLSIGTAKPSVEEQDGIPHWGIDLVDPGERFTVADFQQYTNKKIAEIRSRGHLPIIVGGTGLYVDAIMYDFEFPAEADDVGRRESLMALDLDELYKYCYKNNIQLPENKKNKRYVVNNILRNGRVLKRKHELDPNTIVVGISTERNILRSRIEKRAAVIFRDGVIKEAQNAAAKYGWDNEAMTGNIYPLIHSYLDGHFTMDELEQKFIIRDWQLAKRQLTWLKRNEHIYWASLDEAYTYLTRRLDELSNL
jgi:tRNA dimethylallyltransferase